MYVRTMRLRLKNVERMMDDGLDEGIDWPALPAAAVLLLAGVLVQ
jgi:hypothetical protein